MAASFAGPGKKLRRHDGECLMVVRIAAARMIARWARSPSSPAARRCAALGLVLSATEQTRATVLSMHTCDAHHVVSHSELCTIEHDRRKREFRRPVERCPRRDDG